MEGKWTWLVYLAGDNNLEGAGRVDLDEMARVGSTPEVAILAEFDTEEKKAYRYRVKAGAIETLATMPGINTGDPANLADFVKWGIQTAPAERYALIVWNHGGGLEDKEFNYDAMRTMRPRTTARRLRMNRALFQTTRSSLLARLPHQRAIAIDVGSRDYLDNQELRAAVEDSGVHFDLLGCDACLMNMLEIAYEMRATASVMVGSEETEPGAGWPYAEILGHLAKTPEMTAVDLGKVIVDEYAAWYRAHGDAREDGSATQSALDLSKLATVTEPVNRLGTELARTMDASRTAIALAAQGALTFEVHDYVDLADLCRRLERYLPSASAAARGAHEVVQALDIPGGFVLRNGSWGPRVEAARGVSIFFPRPNGSMPGALVQDYGRLQFVKDLPGWRDMILAYLKSLRD